MLVARDLTLSLIPLEQNRQAQKTGRDPIVPTFMLVYTPASVRITERAAPQEMQPDE